MKSLSTGKLVVRSAGVDGGEYLKRPVAASAHPDKAKLQCHAVRTINYDIAPGVVVKKSVQHSEGFEISPGVMVKPPSSRSLGGEPRDNSERLEKEIVSLYRSPSSSQLSAPVCRLFSSSSRSTAVGLEGEDWLIAERGEEKHSRDLQLLGLFEQRGHSNQQTLWPENSFTSLPFEGGSTDDESNDRVSNLQD